MVQTPCSSSFLHDMLNASLNSVFRTIFMSTGELNVGGIVLNPCIAISILLHPGYFKVYFTYRSNSRAVLNFIVTNYEKKAFSTENWVGGRAK